MNSLQEWLSPPSLAYIAEYLQFCENPEMLSELRVVVPPEALREAAKRLSQRKRNEIKEWVLSLNSAREVGI
jgi:hypothetical protein